MKKVILVVVMFLAVQGIAQVNLVPNYSFEYYDTCPYNQDQIQFATGWSKYSSNSTPTNTDPEYYNSCSSDTLLGVPKSTYGFQADRRNCGAYAGLATYSTSWSNYRDHIGIQLSSPMVVGQKYFLSFYTVMGGDLLLGGYYFQMPSNNIGLRLSTVSYDPNNPSPINNNPHLYLPTVLNDTLNWTRISTSIIADSTYQYVILGNFFNDANTDTMHWNCPECQNSAGYFLVDDVCISTDSMLCNGGLDALPCTVQVPDFADRNELVVFPNPFSDVVHITCNVSPQTEITLYDIFGNTIYSKLTNENTVTIDLSSSPTGTYFLKITTEDQNTLFVEKIIKL